MESFFAGVQKYTNKQATQNEQKQNVPGNRSRTSDLEISVVAIYSLPLCQLSYTREHVPNGVEGHLYILWVALGLWLQRTTTKIVTPPPKKKSRFAVCGDRTHALTNMRLKHAP